MSLPCRAKASRSARPHDPQLHRVRLVAIGAADRMRDLFAEIVELAGVELGGPGRGHQPWHVGALARPAGGRSLRIDALGLGDVLDRVDVTASLAIVLGERVAGEKDHAGRRRFEIVPLRGAAVLGARGGLGHFSIGFVLAGIVFAPLPGVGFPLADRPQRQPLAGLFAALQDRSRQHSQHKRGGQGRNHQGPTPPCRQRRTTLLCVHWWFPFCCGRTLRPPMVGRCIGSESAGSCGRKTSGVAERLRTVPCGTSRWQSQQRRSPA